MRKNFFPDRLFFSTNESYGITDLSVEEIKKHLMGKWQNNEPDISCQHILNFSSKKVTCQRITPIVLHSAIGNYIVDNPEIISLDIIHSDYTLFTEGEKCFWKIEYITKDSMSINLYTSITDTTYWNKFRTFYKTR